MSVARRHLVMASARPSRTWGGYVQGWGRIWDSREHVPLVSLKRLGRGRTAENLSHEHRGQAAEVALVEPDPDLLHISGEDVRSVGGAIHQLLVQLVDRSLVHHHGGA